MPLEVPHCVGLPHPVCVPVPLAEMGALVDTVGVPLRVGETRALALADGEAEELTYEVREAPPLRLLEGEGVTEPQLEPCIVREVVYAGLCVPLGRAVAVTRGVLLVEGVAVAFVEAVASALREALALRESLNDREMVGVGELQPDKVKVSALLRLASELAQLEGVPLLQGVVLAPPLREGEDERV